MALQHGMGTYGHNQSSLFAQVNPMLAGSSAIPAISQHTPYYQSGAPMRGGGFTGAHSVHHGMIQAHNMSSGHGGAFDSHAHNAIMMQPATAELYDRERFGKDALNLSHS